MVAARLLLVIDIVAAVEVVAIHRPVRDGEIVAGDAPARDAVGTTQREAPAETAAGQRKRHASPFTIGESHESGSQIAVETARSMIVTGVAAPEQPRREVPFVAE